jgi:hypothetical protein
LESEHDNGDPCLFDLLLKPIRYVIRDTCLPGIHEVLELIESQETHMTASEQFA